MSALKKIITWLLLLPIYFYRRCISPLLPPACRYTPTCSQYAIEAIQSHGALKGSFLTFKRLCQCHPFYKGDVYDPVPGLRKDESQSSQ